MSEPRIDPTHVQTKRSNAMLIVLILFSVTLAAVAQLTLKHGMNLVNDQLAPDVFSLNGSSLSVVIRQPYVWSGLFLFGLSALVWLLVLSRASLSFAYPFAALTYVLILLADRFILDQDVPAVRWVGVGFIIVGIVLVAQTRHS